MAKTLIIGAGMAGLAAANHLRAHGYAATLIEARDRAGGRTATDQSLGAPIDLGAAWLHGVKDNPLAVLAQQLQLPAKTTDIYNGYIIDRQGRRVPRDVLAIGNTSYERLLHLASMWAKDQPHDVSVAEALAQLLGQHGLPPDLELDSYRWRLMFQSSYYSDSAQYLSARHWEEEGEIDEFPLLMSGYGPLVTHLAQGLDIRFNTVVKKIIWQQSQVHVITNQGELTADKVIVTLPLGVLKSQRLLFEPLLPLEKRLAISRLKMGVLNKVGLRFPYAFWPDDCPNVGYFADRYEHVPIFVNYLHFFAQPILLGYVSGDLARSLEQRTDAEIVADTMQQLRSLFGDKIPAPVGTVITRWWADPFSFGAYSYIPVGASGEDYDCLAQPVGQQLIFAGEATYREFPATARGAYLSGLRAAEEVMAG